MPENYVPALRFGWLTSIYDPVVRWTTRETTVKRHLLAQAQLQPGMRVLDLACGTGTLALMAAQQCPGVQVVGVDGDQAILRIARGKLGLTQVDAATPYNANPDNAHPDGANSDMAKSVSDDRGIRFDRGLATALPYADASFDRVFSTLFFHHLGNTDKHAALREAYRVLAPGAELHIADWGKPANRLMRMLFYFVQMLDGFANTRAHVEGGLTEFIGSAGFSNVEVAAQYNTVFGTLVVYRASRV